MLRARLPLSCVLLSCSCVKISRVPIPQIMGRPASPFICEGKARVTEEEKEKNEREKKASRVARSLFSYMRVPLIL